MAPRGDVSTQIFATWTQSKVFFFWITVLTILASVVFLTVPLGLAFFLLIYTIPIIWKSLADPNPTLGQTIPGTRPHTIAEFINTFKGGNRSHIFSPISLWGFGPPEQDVLKDVERSFFRPPTRLAAYWALGAGFCMSFLDWLIHPYLYPIWGTNIIPLPVAMAISTIFFFGAFQALNIGHRFYQANSMIGATQMPAVLINKIPKVTPTGERPMRKALITGTIGTVVGTAVPLGIAFVPWSAGVDVPWLWVAIGAVSFGISAGTFSAFRLITSIYREEFNHQVERRELWSSIWEFKGNKIPYCDMEVPVPDTDPESPGAPNPPRDENDPPTVWVATFSYPMNGTYADFSEDAERIGSAIHNGEMLTIAPIPKQDPIAGRPIPGTVSDKGFRVWWTSENISLHQLLEENASLPPEKKEIAVRTHILDTLAHIKGINRCLMHSHSMMTTPESTVNIMKVTIVPPKGITETNFTKNIPQITQALGVPWVRAKGNIDANGRSVIELYIGDGTPTTPGIEFPRGAAATRNRKTLISVDWEYSFRINKIESPSGAPSILLSKQVTDNSDKLIIDLPPGVSLADVERKQKELMTSSGNGYIEIHPGITGEKDLSRKEKRELDKFTKAVNSKSQFTAVVSPTDPLDKLFLMKDYYEKVITGREKGVAKMSWSPGVKSDGSLAHFSFEKDFAHLLVAGSSGSGKSVLIYSMLVQMMANNSPEDCQFWIIDPKVGFSPFQYIDSVTRYVDSWTPDEDFFVNVRDLLYDATEEMKRRNAIFRFAADPSNPIDKLSVARATAVKRGPNPDGSPNELMQPFLVIIIDECAMLFAGASDKETKELQAEILYYASKLARESRSAGIHILFATQYPTNASLPSLIRQQAGRLGLSTMDIVASQVIIDQPGLEKLTIKGTGKIQEGKQYFDFRGFLMDFPAENESTMSDTLTALPKRQPDPAIDGERAVAASGCGTSDISAGKEYVEMPEIEESIFFGWNESPVGKSMDIITDQSKREKKGISEKAAMSIKSVSDKMEEEMGSEKLNDLIDNDDKEEFIRAYMGTYQKMKKK